ncbi:MAG: hypothetical protein EOP87_23335, partial [Verrucomicrobiaceae bacterium]
MPSHRLARLCERLGILRHAASVPGAIPPRECRWWTLFPTGLLGRGRGRYGPPLRRTRPPGAMNFVFISPHFPSQYFHFATALRERGVT